MSDLQYTTILFCLHIVHHLVEKNYCNIVIFNENK